MFRKKDWELGEAVIVENHIKHHGGGQGLNNLREWAADVHPVNGQPFRAVLQTPNLALDFREPGVGDVVRVLIDPKSGKVKFDKSDPRISLKAARAREQAHFEDAAAGRPGSPAVPPNPNHDGATSSTTEIEGVRVIGVADAAPILQAFLSGDPRITDEANSQLRQHAAAPSVAERLSTLQLLRDAGSLTDVEYEEQRQRIISSI
ncbi:hypothetical protein ABIA33_002234 [Streptacidiphilus sp. MAP12-16]|uniref:hypothetical protein n=1 Tax=Streptacidiphilus sp. MAP12-16 TaxID=3156300 RepID=UPI003512A05C